MLLLTLSPSPAQAQTYYYTGRNPATPEVNDTASAIACDADAIGVIRYNTGTNAFEGCNGTVWADIRTGATAIPAGANTQVQFNSGGAFGANANFTWNNATGTLTAGNYDTNAATGTYKLGGTTILTYPHAGADTSSFAAGPSALANQTADNRQNTAVGYRAGQYISTGGSNTAVGGFAMNYVSTGGLNTAVGNSAMSGASATPLTGTGNTAVGQAALLSIQGGARNNTALGYAALAWSPGGGDGNTAVGNLAMISISGTPLIGSYNTAVGQNALATIQGNTGSNTALGYNAGVAITTGNSNIIVGTAGNITTGGSNILIGNNLAGTTATASNQLDIGDVITGTTGGSGKIGIGLGSATAPAAILDVNGGINFATGNIVGPTNLNLTTDTTQFYYFGLSRNNQLAARFNGMKVYNNANGPGSTPASRLGFYTDVTNNNGSTEWMTITEGGNVGIGTTSPAAPLHVNRSAAGTISSSGTTVTGTGTTFTTTFAVGDSIMSAGQTQTISGIFSNTSLSTSVAFSPVISAGTAYTRVGAVFNSGNVGVGTTAPGTALDVNGGVTMEPTTVTLTANNTVLATANRSYFQVTSDNTTETNRIFCFGPGTLGQIVIVEWTSSTNRGEMVSHGNCGGAAGAVTASLSYTNWAPKHTETILQLMYNGTDWIQIAGSANY